MLKSKFERVAPIVHQQWNNFISFIRNDLKDLYTEQRHLVVEIKNIERIAKILQHCQDNIEFLLSHRERVIGLDNSLSQKFEILDAFKKRDNLSNAVAIRIFNEILNSRSLNNVINQLNPLKEKLYMIDEEINKVKDLIRGTAFDTDTIIKYGKKHGLGAEEQISLRLYSIFKLSKKHISKKEKQIIPVGNSKEVQTHDQREDTDNIKIEKKLSYNEEFEVYKKKYEQIKNSSNMLLNKYYGILKDMTSAENQYYRIYCYMTADELKEQKFDGEYDEAMAKIVAIKLFDDKNEIEKYIQTIPTNNYSNKEDVEFFSELIKEFKSFVDKLQELDKKIADAKKDTEELEDSKVFFLTDGNNQPFIPDSIREKGYQGSLMNIIKKAQEGHIQKKKGSNIMPLKVSKKFSNEVGKTVFSVRNYKVIASYIKLNSGTGLNDGGIMILTASLLNPNTIQEDTNKVIKGNIENILRQIAAIERGNPEQIGLQAMIREELTSTKEEKKVGELNGRTIK